MALATSPIAPAKISVKNLNFYYGKFHALKNISLEIPEKRVTAFIGPSGCGKSTLLRCFNRMFELYPEQRAEGAINMEGENLLDSQTNVALIRAKIGMVFQKPNPVPHDVDPRQRGLSGLKLFGDLSKGELDPDDLRRDGRSRGRRLWNRGHEQPAGCQTGSVRCRGASSSGCASPARFAVKPGRTADGRALLGPRPHLDPSKIEETIDGAAGVRYTVVIVTHNMQQAARCSDLTAYMYLGELIEYGDTDQIFIKPKRKQTEDYITGRFG